MSIKTLKALGFACVFTTASLTSLYVTSAIAANNNTNNHAATTQVVAKTYRFLGVELQLTAEQQKDWHSMHDKQITLRKDFFRQFTYDQEKLQQLTNAQTKSSDPDLKAIFDQLHTMQDLRIKNRNQDDDLSLKFFSTLTTAQKQQIATHMANKFEPGTKALKQWSKKHQADVKKKKFHEAPTTESKSLSQSSDDSNSTS